MLGSAFQGDGSGGHSACFITSGTSSHPGPGLDQAVSLAQCLTHSRALMTNYQVNEHFPGEAAPVRNTRLVVPRAEDSLPKTVTSAGEDWKACHSDFISGF